MTLPPFLRGPVLRIGHIFFLVYFVYCLVFYRERTIAFDAAFYSFKIIHFGTFDIENGRWGAMYTQLLPLIALGIGCSLKTFLICYSLSFAVWNYLFFLLIAYVLKRPTIAMAFVLSLVLTYRYSFFYPVSEIHSTIGPLFIFFALTDLFVQRAEEPLARVWPLLFALFLVALWIAKIHLLAICPLLFMLAYAALSAPRTKHHLSRLLTAALVSAGVFIIFILLIPKGSFDSMRMVSGSDLLAVVKDVHVSKGYDFFVHEVRHDHLISLFLVATLLVTLFYKRLYLKAIVLVAAMSGFWLLVMANTIQSNSPLNYQNYYCYFGLLISIPFMIDLIPLLPRHLAAISIAFILIFSFYKIFKSGLPLTDRTVYVERMTRSLHASPDCKFVVSPANLNLDLLWGEWDLAFESLLLSSLDPTGPSLTFYGKAPDEKLTELSHSDKNIFLGVDFSPTWFSVKNVNSHPRFFRLGDCFYRDANTPQNSSFADSLFTKETVGILTDPSYSLVRNETRIIPVRIRNKTAVRFNSMPTNEKLIRLSYHLYDKDMNPVQQEGPRCPVEVDIGPGQTIETGLTLDLKGLQRGRYNLVVDLVDEGKRWFNINSKTSLTIY